jgi:hypothetical protein
LSGEAFDEEVAKAIAKQDDVTSYVTRLEQRYDKAHQLEDDMPSPDDMVRELEEFLKSQRRPPSAQGGG